MNTYELLTRNTEEVVTEQEIRHLADHPKGKRVFVGYEPVDALHAGHLLTTNKLIDAQRAGLDVVILLADVYAYLNERGSFEEIHETAKRMKAQFTTYGLDDDQTEFVYGSDFRLDAVYSLDLHKLSVTTSLESVQKAMEGQSAVDSSRVSDTVFPLMKILDIEFLDIDLVVGGAAQRELYKLSREKLPELGYEARPCLFTPPLADLQTGKIELPTPGTSPIVMDDSTADLEQKIESAYCPPTREPDGARENSILQLFQYFVFPRFESVTVRRPVKHGGDQTYDSYDALAAALEFGELHPEDAKQAATRYFDELIAPVRNKLQEIANE